jgi:hypothetical protein
VKTRAKKPLLQRLKVRKEKNLVTVDANAVLILDERERDAINTMIDFFRSSGEDQSLDPEVYEGIAEKLGNGRTQMGVDALPLLQKQLLEHTRELFALAHDTVGLDETGIPDPNTAQGMLWRDAITAFETCERVIAGLVVAENEKGFYNAWRDELMEVPQRTRDRHTIVVPVDRPRRVRP